jgi:integrase/recombinase XerD
MTQLRKRMLEELQRRNYSPNTSRACLCAVEEFASYFGKSPDKLGQEHLRQYQRHLLHGRKLTVGTIVGRIAALRFFFVKVLRRPYRQIDLIYPKRPERLPTVLSQEEVAQLIDSATNLLDYAMLMTLYATGMRRAELSRLKVEDIDSQRMIIHIRQGKGNRDRDVPLTPSF